MEAVAIYTNVGCLACHLAKDFFTQYKINFVEGNLAPDRTARDELFNLGFRAVPVVRVCNETMVGFRASKLRKMAEEL